MLPFNISEPTHRGRPSLNLLARNIFRRYWPVIITLTLVALYYASAYAPRRYQLSRIPSSFFRSPRPQGGPRPPPIPVVDAGDVWGARAHEVREAFVHAYEGYRAYALPADEVRPMSGGSINNFHGWGVTMFDSLDTMWLMGLEDMFFDTVRGVQDQQWRTPRAHFFEVVIRYLGGALSAYALSEDPRLLKLADDLGTQLLPAFDTPTGFSVHGVDTELGRAKGGEGPFPESCLAELFSNQMEYKYLAHLTGKAKYFEVAERPMRVIYPPEKTLFDGLLATTWKVNTAEPNLSDFTAGGCADSAYEYFLKQWLMSGKTELRTRELSRMRSWSICSMLGLNGNCWLFALAAHPSSGLNLSDTQLERHLWAAEGLAETCWAVYGDTTSGLSPDSFRMDAENERWTVLLREWDREGRVGPAPGTKGVELQRESGNRGYVATEDVYLLRPEAVETFYVMWRTTGEVKWRERGWSVFQSLQKYTRVKHGFTTVRHLDEIPFQFDDMPRPAAHTLSMVEDKYIGLALAVSSSAAIGTSIVITKKGLTAAANAGSGSEFSYLRNPIWWAGMSTLIIGEVANFAAYSFAPPVLVTPLGALSVLIGAILASFLLNEQLGHLGRVGCALCLLGSVIIVLHAPDDRPIETITDFLNYAMKPGFLMYCFTVCALAIFLAYAVAPKHGRTNPTVYISIASIVGSVSVMFIKGFGVAVKLTFAGKNQFVYPSTFVFGLISVGCIVIQLNYYNKALDLFSVNIVNPMYYVGFCSATIVASLILFEGFNTTDASNTFSLLCGFIVTFLGVHILNLSMLEESAQAVEEGREDAAGFEGRLSLDGWHGIQRDGHNGMGLPSPRGLGHARRSSLYRNPAATLFNAYDPAGGADHVGLQDLREEEDDEGWNSTERTSLRTPRSANHHHTPKTPSLGDIRINPRPL
ncbi:unnamed protein product [Mycena citricolor]|uniref:alpha-1,2-Mannosidase n=1 Tax=Mycena citricolor TaxID=2018698 RepID=A0AAD2HAU7_9AGAR|nr:unnamed protein product [Mycena citricolor]